MQGDLADTSAVDLCLRLAAQSTTGTLVLSSAAGTAELVFVEGRLAGGRSPATSGGSQRLGERLVAAGRLDPSDLDATLAEQAAASPSSAPLGQRLVDRGLVSVDIVRLGLQEQALAALQEVAGWFEGSFRVEPTPPPAGVRVAMPADRALQEVARRTDDRRELALQAVGQSADREGTAPSREEFDLSASPTTGTRPVGLTDDGWANRLDTTPAPDEPEPWVGWANAARHTEQAPAPSTPEPARAAQAPAQEPAAPAPAPQPAAEAPRPAPAHEPAAPQAFTEPARPATPLDADTRRELFSELHEMGRPAARTEPTPPAPPAATPAPGPEPQVEPEADPSEGLEIAPPGPPPASLSRSDVSELLAELHALNLDDDGRG